MRREEWVDLSKGIAIILVVLGHVLASYMVTNMFQTHSWVIKYLHSTIYSFHMPLYFALSGYLYSNVEKNNNSLDYKNLVFKKLIGLGIPYIIFSIMQGLVQILLSSFTHNHIGFLTLMYIPIQPILQFWFIYTLLFIFIIVPLIDLIVKNDKLVVLLLFMCKITSFILVTNIVAIDTFLDYAIYFYSGKMLFKYYKNILCNKSLLLSASIIYAILNAICFFLFRDFYNMKLMKNILDIILAITGSLLVIYLVSFPIAKTKSLKKYISILGKYSFEIYIFHIMFAYGTKTILIKLQVQNLFLHLFLDTFVGIVVPIAIAYIARKIPFAYYMIYPNKYFKQKYKIKVENNI